MYFKFRRDETEIKHKGFSSIDNSVVTPSPQVKG